MTTEMTKDRFFNPTSLIVTASVSLRKANLYSEDVGSKKQETKNKISELLNESKTES